MQVIISGTSSERKYNKSCSLQVEDFEVLSGQKGDDAQLVPKGHNRACDVLTLLFNPDYVRIDVDVSYWISFNNVLIFSGSVLLKEGAYTLHLGEVLFEIIVTK